MKNVLLLLFLLSFGDVCFAKDTFVVTQKHAVKNKPPETDPNPVPTPDIEPDHTTPEPPRPSGCQCGCGRQVCNCGRAGASSCAPIEFIWSPVAASIEPQKDVSGEMVIEAFSSITCSACSSYKQHIPNGSVLDGVVLRWRDDAIPSDYEKVDYLPAFYCNKKLVANTNDFQGVLFSEIHRRLVRGARQIVESAPKVTVEGVSWGSMQGKQNLDTFLEYWGSTFGSSGTHTFPEFYQKRMVFNGAVIDLPKTLQVRWKFEGQKKSVQFITKPKFTLYRLVSVDLSGLKYDGTSLTLEVDGLVDPVLSVKD